MMFEDVSKMFSCRKCRVFHYDCTEHLAGCFISLLSSI